MALALGKTVAQLLIETSSAELTEWHAFYALEPWGDLVADQRHGIATAALANVHRDSKRTPEPYRAVDFIYWHPSHSEATAGQAVFKSDPEAQSQLIKQMIFKSSKKG